MECFVLPYASLHALDSRYEQTNLQHRSTELTLASCLEQAGELENAEQLYSEVLRAMHATIGEEHLSTLKTFAKGY